MRQAEGILQVYGRKHHVEPAQSIPKHYYSSLNV